VVAYVRRFRERSLDVREEAKESKLLQICAEGLLPEYICHLINEMREGTFSAFLKSARNISLVVRPNPVVMPMVFRQPIQPGGGRPQPPRVGYTEGSDEGKAKKKDNKRKFGRDREDPPPLSCTIEEAVSCYNAMVQGGTVYRPKGVPTEEPDAVTRTDPRYCQVHRKIQHPTESCFTLRRIIDKYMKAGTLQIPPQNVNDNPLPAHGANLVTAYDEEAERGGRSAMRQEEFEETLELCTRGMANVVLAYDEASARDMEEIYSVEGEEADPVMEYNAVSKSPKFTWFFDQVGIPKERRLEITQAILDIARRNAVPSLKWRGPMARLVKKFLSEVTFSDADRAVRFPHNRPLYVTASINGVSFARTLMDGGASINIMPINSFHAANIPEERLVPMPLVISGYDNQSSKSI